MHHYLRAIGFSKLRTRKELDNILGTVLTHPSFQRNFSPKNGFNHTLVESNFDFSERIGISIRGEYDEKGFFHLEHYFPYLTGKHASSYEVLSIHKRVDTDAYTGMADNNHFGISLIFYLQNSLDFLEMAEQEKNMEDPLALTLSALSTSGKIILPVQKTTEQIRLQQEEFINHDNLLFRAKNGDEDAINKLTIKDIDKYAMISRRMLSEDLYSVVESSLIPYGSESDHYTLIGEIKEVIPHVNSLTGESLTELIVNCNGLLFFICMNNADLFGEPMVGRRFKGNVWLQGRVDFH